MRWLALTVAVALPVQVAVGPDGAVDGRLDPGDRRGTPAFAAPPPGSAPRVEAGAADVGTARQVSLSETLQQGRPEQASAKEREAGKALFESGKFAWGNEHFKADYDSEFGHDDARCGLLNFLRCLTPVGMFTSALECMEKRLKHKRHAEKNLATKQEAIDFIVEVAKEDPDKDGGSCFADDMYANYKPDDYLKTCMEGNMDQFHTKLQENCKAFIKEPNAYDHGVLDARPMIDEGKTTPRQLQSLFFQHMLDAHQAFATKPTQQVGGIYGQYKPLFDRFKGGPGRKESEMSKFQMVLTWAQMNVLMEELGPEGPIGAEQIKTELKMDKKLKSSDKSVPAPSLTAWPALLLLVA